MTTKKQINHTHQTPPKRTPLTREAALHTGRIVKLPGHTRTKDDIERELAALPAGFVRTKIPAIVMLREAEELLRRCDDVPIFASRGIDVGDGHFRLIADLSALLRDAAGIRDVAGAVHGGYAQLEAHYAEELRRGARRLRLLAELNGLSPELAVLGNTRGTVRLMEAVASMTVRLTPHLDLFEQADDEARILVAQLEEMVGAMQELRTKQADEAGVEHLGIERVHRVKRLLLEVLRYVGVAGQYVFDGDPAHAASYQLQHLTRDRRPKKQKPAAAVALPKPSAPLAARNGEA